MQSVFLLFLHRCFAERRTSRSGLNSCNSSNIKTMKKFFTMMIMVLAVAVAMAQAPEKFSYQAVVRNASNALVTNAQVGVRVSILQGSASGNAVYVETHTANTNANGLLTLEIGGGKAEQGAFNRIDWANGPYFLKTETDPNGGGDYSITSVQQLLSVPYALYAKEAANGFSGDYNELKNKPTIPTIPTDVSVFNNDVEYVTVPQLKAANYVTNTGSGCDNDVDLCDLQNRIDSLQNQLQFLAGSVDELYSLTNDTCLRHIVTINGNPNVCYNGANEEPNVILTAWFDGYANLTATYSWYENGMYRDVPVADYIFEERHDPTYNNPLIFTVKVSLSNGCSYFSRPFEVNVYDMPRVNITGGPASITPGETVTLRANLDLNNYPTVRYQWFANMAYDEDHLLAGHTHAEESFIPTETTDYIARVSYLMDYYNSEKCSSIDTFRVNVTTAATLPTVTTNTVGNITETTATCGGEVTADGGVSVTARGVCWGTNPNPTVTDNHTSDGTGTGTFSSSISGLTAGTTYFVRAYATNSVGTAYGEAVSFTAADACAAITLPYSENFDSYTNSTTAATGVEPTCWQLMQSDVAMTNANRPQLYYKSSYAHSGSYSLLLNYRGVYAMPALSENVQLNQVTLEMYLRQPKSYYALEVGVWEDNGTFVPVTLINNSTTNVEFVEVDFSNYSGNGRRIAFRNVLGGGANYNYSYNYIDDINLRGIENPNAGCETISLPYTDDFESYTTVTTVSTGVEPTCWELVQEDVAMTDASRPQLYYKSSFAHSGNYSLKLGNRGVYALPALPENVAVNHVHLEMYLRQANAAYRLEVGIWEENGTFVPVTLINNSTTNVEHVEVDFSNYSGNGRRIAFHNVLANGANYNYSYNYLDDITLDVRDGSPCPSTPTVTDHEGNVYATVQIGNQCWMRENLRTTTSPSTGTYLIPAASTGYTETGKQARWFNNDSVTYAPMNYGLLYNWYAAVDTFNTAYVETSVNADPHNAVLVSFTENRRGICPAGWHLPSDAEWTQLTNYVKTQSDYWCSGSSGSIAKSLASETGWNSFSNIGCCVGYDQTSNNATGFSAVPAGYCDGSSLNNGAGSYTSFWSSTEYCSTEYCTVYAYHRSLDNNRGDITRNFYMKRTGMSVRCLRD